MDSHPSNRTKTRQTDLRSGGSPYSVLHLFSKASARPTPRVLMYISTIRRAALLSNFTPWQRERSGRKINATWNSERRLWGQEGEGDFQHKEALQYVSIHSCTASWTGKPSLYIALVNNNRCCRINPHTTPHYTLIRHPPTALCYNKKGKPSTLLHNHSSLHPYPSSSNRTVLEQKGKTLHKDVPVSQTKTPWFVKK